MKWIPIAKMSKTERRKYYAARRGSWNGVSPIPRIVQSRKKYDRNRAKQEERRAPAD